MSSSLSALAKQSGLVLLCAVWLALGLFGHDPWKPDEAYTFGLVYHIVGTGDWIVPTLAGEPFMEKPPAFFVTAALFAQATRDWLPLHDGARLASAFYVGLSMLFLALAGRELYGKNVGSVAVMLLIGCLGFLVRSHQLTTDTALFCGIALGLYALALAPRRPLAGGLLLGCGAGLAFLAKGLLGPGLLAVTALLLPLFANWRQQSYFLSWLWALVAVTPWLLVWPLALYQRSPALFEEWLVVNNIGRFLGFVRLGPQSEPLFYLKTLPWFAWPALPLALWTMWAGLRGLNGGLARPGIQLPGLAFAVMFTVLSLAADARELYALPMLLPLCLLAAAGVDSLRRGASAALDWFGILTFGLLALALWIGWAALLTGQPAPLAKALERFHPGYSTQFVLNSFIVSTLLTLLWFALVRPARRSNRRAVLNWAAGVTLVWGLAMTLWLPYIDYDKSYRGMMSSLRAALPRDAGCVASAKLGEPQRALLDYFVGLTTERLESGRGADCVLLLVQGSANESEDAPEGEWRKLWQGTRPDDEREVYRLYRRVGVPKKPLG